MLTLSDKVIFVAVILAGIVVIVILWRAMYILKVKKAAKAYNRFVYDYYGKFDKPTPVLIVRYQNDYIRAYNRQCKTLVGRVFFFEEMPLVDDPTYQYPSELFRSTLPRNPTTDYGYMQEEQTHTKQDIEDAVNFRFNNRDTKDAKKYAKRTMRIMHKK